MCLVTGEHDGREFVCCRHSLHGADAQVQYLASLPSCKDAPVFSWGVEHPGVGHEELQDRFRQCVVLAESVNCLGEKCDNGRIDLRCAGLSPCFGRVHKELEHGATGVPVVPVVAPSRLIDFLKVIQSEDGVGMAVQDVADLFRFKEGVEGKGIKWDVFARTNPGKKVSAHARSDAWIIFEDALKYSDLQRRKFLLVERLVHAIIIPKKRLKSLPRQKVRFVQCLSG